MGKYPQAHSRYQNREVGLGMVATNPPTAVVVLEYKVPAPVRPE